MKLLMLTFVRTSELINAPWSEIDLDEATWIIPASRMKMRRDHIVPLSRQVIEILHELKERNGHREQLAKGGDVIGFNIWFIHVCFPPFEQSNIFDIQKDDMRTHIKPRKERRIFAVFFL